MSIAYLDTHVAVWLHDGLVEKLTLSAKDAIEASILLISPMVYLEFSYLHQRGRIRLPAQQLYTNLHISFGVTLCNQNFPPIAAAATELLWTNDPFDRIIVAQSQCAPKSCLITADTLIRQHYPRAIW